MPAGMVVSENGRPEFSKDGTRLFFGYAKPPAAEPAEDATEPVKVDIWNWKDPLLQPMQKVRAEAEKKRNYRAVVHLKDKRLVPLASEDMPDLTIVDNTAVALGASDVAYRQLVSWDAEHNDYYAVNLQDGSRKKLLEKSRFAATLSPGGTYLLCVQRRRQPVVLRARQRRREDEPHGQARRAVRRRVERHAGAGARVRIGRLDVRRPVGAALRQVRHLGGEARRHRRAARHGRRRAQDADRVPVRADSIPRNGPSRPTSRSSSRRVNDVTKATGYYRVTPAAAAAAPAAKPAKGKAVAPAPAPLAASYGEPAKLVMLDKRLASPAAGGAPVAAGPAAGGRRSSSRRTPTARSCSRRSASRSFPNLWTAGPNFENLTKVSDANPQQAQYVWGRSELIDYSNADGKTLRAILTKPENFDPAKKYPLMVYIYEELTNGLHRYVDAVAGHEHQHRPLRQQRLRRAAAGHRLRPRATRARARSSASSRRCSRCVGMGFIDPARIGIQGHSWGGYQITYLITRTDMFRAVAGRRVGVEHGERLRRHPLGHGHVARVPVRAHAEPHRRRRRGSRTLQFIENSPIFWVEKVNTPYLTIHNDEDDAVPWYQGIEFFSALRRLGKEAYMFNFNTEKHGLRERENQKHWTIYQDEFFDHYLLGKPRPEWMDKGVPLPRSRQAGRGRVLQEVGARGY